MKNGDLEKFTDSEEKGLKTVYNNFEEETAAKNNIVKWWIIFKNRFCILLFIKLMKTRKIRYRWIGLSLTLCLPERYSVSVKIYESETC